MNTRTLAKQTKKNASKIADDHRDALATAAELIDRISKETGEMPATTWTRRDRKTLSGGKHTDWSEIHGAAQRVRELADALETLAAHMPRS